MNHLEQEFNNILKTYGHSVLLLHSDKKTVCACYDRRTASADKDCPYCHLGAMKSMIQEIEIVPMVLDNSPPPEIIHYHYVNTVPRQPERPNWMPAA